VKIRPRSPSQAQPFDPVGECVRRYVPELAGTKVPNDA
jgi:hypothetical protein